MIVKKIKPLSLLSGLLDMCFCLQNIFTTQPLNDGSAVFTSHSNVAAELLKIQEIYKKENLSQVEDTDRVDLKP